MDQVFECHVRCVELGDMVADGTFRDSSPSVVCGARALQSIVNGGTEDDVADDDEISALIAGHLDPPYRALVQCAPHPNGGARVLETNWADVERVCGTADEQRHFAEQFVALGLAERPLRQSTNMPFTCRVPTGAYFCLALVGVCLIHISFTNRSTAAAPTCPSWSTIWPIRPRR